MLEPLSTEDLMDHAERCPRDGRLLCHMPGCSIEINEGEKYCAACLWMKAEELRRTANE